MSRANRRALLAWSLASVSLALMVAADLLVLWHHLHHGPHGYPYWLEGSIAVVTWVSVGLLMALRVPDNPLGWMALGFITLGASQDFTGALAVRVAGAGGPTTTVDLLAAVSAFSQLSGVGCMALYVHLVPSGRPLSRRWRPPFIVACAGVVSIALKNALTDSGVRNLVAVAHAPVHLPSALLAALRIAGALFAVGTVAGVVSIVVRWRRAASVERQQLKWIAAATMAAVALLAIGQPLINIVAPHVNWPGSVLWALVGAAVPVGTAVAILRYRLYDVDRIVSRTAGYVVVTAVLAGLYAACVVVTTDLLQVSSSLGVAVSTLAAAAAFHPARHRVQGAVDRRFNRSRYDSLRVVDAFSGRLRDQVDAEAIRTDLVAAVHRTVAPASVSLWTPRGVDVGTLPLTDRPVSRRPGPHGWRSPGSPASNGRPAWR